MGCGGLNKDKQSVAKLKQRKPTQRKAGSQKAQSRQRLTETARQGQALALRLTGATYERIAQELHYHDRGGAWRAIEKALDRTLEEPAKHVRKLEAARMDALLTGIWTSATQPASPQDQELCETLTTLLDGVRPASARQAAQLDALREWVPLLVERAQTQHLDAFDRVLKIMARRAALLGLDAPAKVAPTTPDGTQPYEPPSPQGIADEFVSGVAAILAQYGQLAQPEDGAGAGA